MESHLVTHQKIKEQPTIILLNCLQTFFDIRDTNILNCDKNNSREIYKELFKRLVTPFYLPVLTLISLLLILTSKENIKYTKNKFITFFIGFGIIIISESSLGYISNNLIKNISIAILPIILIIVTYFVFIYSLNLFNRKIS